MECSTKVVIFPGPLAQFDKSLPKILKQFRISASDSSGDQSIGGQPRDDQNWPFRKKFELRFFPRQFVNNFFSVLKTTDNDKFMIGTALQKLSHFDPVKDFDNFARNAVPILQWIHLNKDVLGEIVQLLYSGNPYIYRHISAYRIVSKDDESYGAGIEAYQLSFPITETLVYFFDGYDPIGFDLCQPLGSIFDLLVDFVAEKANSPVIAERLHRLPDNFTSKQRKGGRPSNPDDDWAFQQVIIHGRRIEEIYPEWRQRIGNRAQQLADPLDSLKKAIRQRRRNFHEEKRD